MRPCREYRRISGREECKQPRAEENVVTNREVFFEVSVLRVDGGGLESRSKALALLLPPFLVHLGEERVAAERLEPVVLLWRLRPVLVRNLSYQFRIPYVDNAGEQSVPLRSSASELQPRIMGMLLTVW